MLAIGELQPILDTNLTNSTPVDAEVLRIFKCSKFMHVCLSTAYLPIMQGKPAPWATIYLGIDETKLKNDVINFQRVINKDGQLNTKNIRFKRLSLSDEELKLYEK